MQPLEQDFQRGCAVSVLGDFQGQVGQSPQQQPMKSKLTHLWARVWTGVLLRRALKCKGLHIYAMKIKYQYMSLKSLYIYVYISIACCFSFFFLPLILVLTKKFVLWLSLQFLRSDLDYKSSISSQILSNSSSINFIQYFTFCTFAKASLPFCCPVDVWLSFKISKLKLWPLEQNIFPNIKDHTDVCVANSLFQFNAELKGKLHLLIEGKSCCCFFNINM